MGRMVERETLELLSIKNCKRFQRHYVSTVVPYKGPYNPIITEMPYKAPEKFPTNLPSPLAITDLTKQKA
jgi:hypothetical protein